MELVSVVIPVYNVEKYLNKCIDSVIKQTYTELEIILVDDGSTDDSGLICEEYRKQDGRIVVLHKKNGGLSDARNFGIKAAKGKYITFIDSDDYIFNDYVEYLIKNLKKYNAQISCANLILVDENGRQRGYCGRSGDVKVLNVQSALAELLEGIKISNSASAKLYLKELFDAVEYPVGKHFEDLATTYRLFMKASIIVTGDRPVYNYLVRKGSISRSEFNKNSLDLVENAEMMAATICSSYPELKSNCIDRMFDSVVMVLSICYDKEVEKFLLEKLKFYRADVMHGNALLSKRKLYAIASYLPCFTFLLRKKGR